MSKLTVSLVLRTILPTSLYLQGINWQFVSAATAVILLVCGTLLALAAKYNVSLDKVKTLAGFARFIYASFLKSHSGDGTGAGQQGALESFYKIQVCHLLILMTEANSVHPQADVYDSTRNLLLRGREDMLGLIAAQLSYKASHGEWPKAGPIWVDVRIGRLASPAIVYDVRGL